MPEGIDPLAKRLQSAVGVVESHWRQAGLRPRKLDARERAAYRGRAVEMGWRFDADFPDRRRRLDVLVTAGFPFVPARIALVDRPSFLTWPHVESDGTLCLVPDHATFPIDDPYAGIAELLKMTFDLIEALIRGERTGDFQTEFLTYWHHAGRGRTRTILSLIEPAPPSRIVRIWEGIRTRFPLGPGDIVFGKPIERRTVHSIRTLSLETNLHPKRLRKLLQASGALPDGAADLADGNCLIDAETASLVATEASAATMSVRKAGEYLNAPRVQRDMLYRSGLLIPRIRAAEHGAADQFAAADLDAFLASLMNGAEPTDARAPSQANIPEAARAAFCGSQEVVQVVLDGKLERKWVLTTERGYMSLLVDVEELRARVRGPDHGGFTSIMLKDRLQTTDRVARALMAQGHLKTITVTNPVNRCPTVIVPMEEIERFEAKYISLFALARRQDRHFMLVKKKLVARGITPALDPEKIGATFYRRADFQNLQS